MNAWLLTTLLLAQGVPVAAPKPIPTLLLTGANNHDWPWTSQRLKQHLEAQGRFEVTVTSDPAATLASAKALEAFDLFVVDYNGPRWREPAESNFLDAVRGGKGVVLLHAANNAFQGWIDYERMAALCWRRGTGHGRFHTFDVEITDRDHPITRHLPDLVGHPDELYHDLLHMHGAEHRVLARARSSVESGGTGDLEPVMIVTEYGAGRVFHTPLGHVWPDQEATRASLLDPQLGTLLARGAEWAASGEVDDGPPANRLEPWDRKAGWRLLFDGASTAGWTRHGGQAFPETGWVVENGALRCLPPHRTAEGGRGGDLATVESFSDFELEFEWKVAAGANSGVKYRVQPAEEPAGLFGPEYQVLDDGPEGPGNGRHSAAALYDVIEPVGKVLAPVGEWNRARVVARGSQVEHWVNGRRVVSAELDSAEWRAALATSKFALRPDFGLGAGPIGLQDHGGEAWYRSLKVRDLTRLPGREEPLFDGESLAGWHALGDARFEVREGVLHAEVGGGSQSFLTSDATYGDFVLELELRIEAGNSGIQVRSQEQGGRLVGYQLEVDPSDRAWSGGLYDEARRGWLQNLAQHPEGRAAFRRDGWNHYRIECVGPSIRCWVNGVPTADYLDTTDAEGHIGIQVHSGTDTRLACRNLSLRVL